MNKVTRVKTTTHNYGCEEVVKDGHVVGEVRDVDVTAEEEERGGTDGRYTTQLADEQHEVGHLVQHDNPAHQNPRIVMYKYVM